ncbi:hypothetical protein CcCBS67573_g09955 [Chytriomyces confervae]|uniref:Uncharacterized protein n=1 Tax=Chytriomyces confervae TaxID=246404 RepID=A0A507DLC4_9FUNG|nr:hypothetical protein CcCBS67573_g09955 [Chytriomyces confervae]
MSTNGEGIVHSSGERHMSGESNKSSNGGGSEGKKDKNKDKMHVAIRPPVKLNLQRRKSEAHVKQKSVVEEVAGVASKGNSRADALLQGMLQGNNATLIGKWSHGHPVSIRGSRYIVPLPDLPRGNNSSDSALHTSPPTRLPYSIPQADFIHIRASSPSTASVHFMEGSENVVFMASTPLPGAHSGDTGSGSDGEYTAAAPGRSCGKSFSSYNEDGDESSALAKFRAKRAAERAAKRGGQ